MSTKTSPLNVVKQPSTLSTSSASSTSSTPPPPTVGPSSTTTATPITVATADAMTAIKIKSEMPSDEIKEYAETTMKELLGWYGFDGVDRLDLSSKTSRLLQSAANQREQQHQQHQQHHMERRNHRNRGMSGGNRVASLMQMQQQRDELMRKVAASNNNNITSHTNNNCGNSSRKNSFSQNFRTTDGAISDHDTRSSREDDSKSPHSTASKTAIGMEDKIDLQNCCWCRRAVPENAPEFLTTSDGPRYCSESCFTQSRRASFKKAKTCDWCKHVRHAVSYVDFQDGASQLQFCSDKCLNQYKMQIFCKETQAHLDMNPHLREQGLEAAAAGNGAGLITPDLWLRNCRSRSASPASTVSVSPVPTPSRKSPIATTPPATATPFTTVPAQATSTPHKPIISVAPVSKLMSKSPSIMAARTSPKHNRKKRQLRSSVGSSVASDLHAPPKSNSRELAALTGACATGGSGTPMINKCKSLLQVNTGATNQLRASPGHVGGAAKSTASSLSQFAGSSVQDLHMSVPPLSPMMDQQAASHAQPAISLSSGHHGASIIPPSYFATPTTTNGPAITPAHQLPPSGYGAHRPPHPPPQFLPNHGMPPRFMGGYPAAGPPQLPPHFMQHPSADFNGGLGALFGPQPPVTIMVPYPVIIPLPIPIPVPIPIKHFYKAYLSAEQRAKFDEEERQRSDEHAGGSQICRPTDTDEPLDCSKSKDEPMLKNEEHSEAMLAERMATELPTSPGPIVRETLKTPPPKTDASTANVTNDGNDDNDDDAAREKLPKLKITRLQTKRTLLVQTKESECSRPLRKRKRIIDCDFQKIALKEESDAAADEAGPLDGCGETAQPSATTRNDHDDHEATPPIPVCNTHNINNNNNNNNDKE